MLDAEYFREHLTTQIQELGFGSCSVVIHLTDGSSLTAKSVNPKRVHDGYVLLEVFPEEGVTEESKAKRRKEGGSKDVFYDRVAVPYEYITRVLLTVAAPEGENFIGFDR